MMRCGRLGVMACMLAVLLLPIWARPAGAQSAAARMDAAAQPEAAAPLSAADLLQAEAASPQAATLHSQSNLVLVDVIALKNGLPDKTLRREDFEVFDNGHAVEIKTFDSGANFTTRPLALWLVVQCSMQDYDAEGSGFFRGHVALFQTALGQAEARDKIAVAHWCDDGQAKIDLLPASDAGQALTAVERVLAPIVNPADHERTGELALQKTLQLIVDTTRALTPEPVPVVIFLYGDHSGMPRDEADRFINELLETSAVAFGVKDKRSKGILFLLGEQKEIAHYIVKQTGGEYLSATPATYAAALEQILQQLHFRYELGFKPQTLDGKRHQLRVRLTDAARKRHKGVRLRSRTGYVPVGF